MLGSLRAVSTSQKRLTSPVLNLVGIQMLRVVLARASLRLRRRRVGAGGQEQLRSLERQGFCIIPDFLPAAQFEELRADAEGALDAAVAEARLSGFRVDADRFARVRIELVDGIQKRTPIPIGGAAERARQSSTRLLAQNERLLDLIAAHQRIGPVGALSTKGRFGLTLERLLPFVEGRVAVVSDLSDHELHADTFHTITKAFLYLRDTDESNGSFVFVPESHRITLNRLVFDYRHSLAPDGVLRYRSSAADVERLNGHPQSLCVAANTLIVANTQGLHARGGVDPGRHRDTLCLQYRPTHIV